MFCLAKVKTDQKFLFDILRGQKVTRFSERYTRTNDLWARVFSSENFPKHGVKLEYFVMKFLKKKRQKFADMTLLRKFTAVSNNEFRIQNWF